MTVIDQIARLKITLDAVRPKVLRRIEVPVSATLDALHEMIQVIMPWGNYHSYEFYVRQRETHWGIPYPEMENFGFQLSDARKTTLERALSGPNFKVLRYTYDFGDDWLHTIKVERRFSAELWEEFPRLIDAKGRCPPEDVGGPWGYAQYLEAMTNPHHAQHAEWLEWRGPFDPDVVDRAKIENALSAFVKRPRRKAVPSPRPKPR
jgi:hypothetical protein